ncbi:hypothetical protein GCM10022295_30180 [Streptomyces osmaniensis]|uniref:Uncharacterized protein n=1 Tax=Streptomyces osmaniensis TaxID=593134 RepID=A0ABP6W6D5_9ACTN
MKYSGTSMISAAAAPMPASPVTRLAKVSFIGVPPRVRWRIHVARRFSDDLNPAARDMSRPWA